MSNTDDTFSMRKVAKTWTSPRLYEILKKDKVILKLKDEEDAKQVVEYLNKNFKESGRKGSKTKKSTAKKSSSKKSTGKKSTKKSVGKKTGEK